jgi:integrase
MTMMAAEAVAFASGLRVSSRSCWEDAIWHLDGIRPAACRADLSLDWGFTVCDELLTHPTWTPWCTAAKTFLWSLKIDPPPGRAAVQDASIASRFKNLRLLMRWMASQGYRRFSDLHSEASQRFLTTIAARRGRTGRPVKSLTLQQYRGLLELLYLQGARYPQVAIQDPFPGIGARCGGLDRSDKGWLPYTPDAVAVALVSAALRLLGTPADEVIALQRKTQCAYDKGLADGLTQKKVGLAAMDAIAEFHFSILPGEKVPWHTSPVRSTKDVHCLVDRIYDTCFVAIAYLVGARVSEILGLQVGCIEHRSGAEGSERFAYIVGRIYKTASGSDGDGHLWVASPAVERAIFVMERLSESLRQRSGRADLWLVMKTPGLLGPSANITIPGTNVIISRLNKGFAPFIDLPPHQDRPWHLTTHQGRKTFARFVGKRDRTGLHALQAHFGHVSLAMTDRGYVGTDFALDELVDRHAQEETRAALEELLTATALGGKGGHTIACRSQFRGRTRDANVQAYVDFLMAETDLRLGVCDWGYCVYSMETSACLGNEKGPNPVLRTENICATCANFAVTGKHRSVWEGRRIRNAALLEQPALDSQSRLLVQERIVECERILVQIDHGNTARHVQK